MDLSKLISQERPPLHRQTRSLMTQMPSFTSAIKTAVDDDVREIQARFDDVVASHKLELLAILEAQLASILASGDAKITGVFEDAINKVRNLSVQIQAKDDQFMNQPDPITIGVSTFVLTGSRLPRLEQSKL
jgi:histidinol dehydrogenase